jgi:arginine utilization protein RocB
MSLLNQLGITGMNSLMGQNHQQLSQQSNQAFNNMMQQLNQNPYAQYNQLMNQSVYQHPIPPVLWKFNGTECTIREFADMVWANDCAEKTHFILKYE